MIGLGLRQLQDALNHKADVIQREFVAASDRLQALGKLMLEERGESREKLRKEQDELRAGVTALERRFGPDDLRVAAALAALGELREARQPGAGRDPLARAQAITRKVYGDGHGGATR